jgi:hypothetical protein
MSNTGPYGTYQADMGTMAPNIPALITFIIPVAGNPTTLGTTTTTFPALALDTVGNALYITTNGSTWTLISSGGGGGGTQQVFVGHGSPEGVVTAAVSGTQGFLYYDLDSGVIYEKSGSGNTGWF